MEKDPNLPQAPSGTPPAEPSEDETGDSSEGGEEEEHPFEKSLLKALIQEMEAQHQAQRHLWESITVMRKMVEAEGAMGVVYVLVSAKNFVPPEDMQYTEEDIKEMIRKKVRVTIVGDEG